MFIGPTSAARSAAAGLVADPGSTSHPTCSSTLSGMPASRLATTGTPRAMASRITTGMASLSPSQAGRAGRQNMRA